MGKNRQQDTGFGMQTQEEGSALKKHQSQILDPTI